MCRAGCTGHRSNPTQTTGDRACQWSSVPRRRGPRPKTARACERAGGGYLGGACTRRRSPYYNALMPTAPREPHETGKRNDVAKIVVTTILWTLAFVIVFGCVYLMIAIRDP